MIEFNKANEWIESTGKNIELLESNNCYLVKYNGISSKITKPTSNFGYYVVCQNDNVDYLWYNSINRYCIEKEPSLKNVLSKLTRLIEKEITNQTTKNENNIDTNLEYYTIKSDIKKLIGSGFCDSKLNSDDNLNEMYDETIVGEIITDEFLECWKYGKDSGLMDFELNNNNIYSWHVKINSFDNKSKIHTEFLNVPNDLKCVELEILFNGKYYPNYPPSVKIIRPNLKESLGHRISNSKITQLAYWTPTRNTLFVINRIKHILEKFGSIESHNSIKKNNIYSLNMTKLLSKFSSLIDLIKDDDDIDKDMKFTKFNIRQNNIKQTQPTKANKNHINKIKTKSGIGYEGYAQWNIEEYTKIQKEKDKEISSLIGKIILELQSIDNTSEEFEEVCEIISNSLLLQYLKQQFKNSSLLEMQNREVFFKLLINLLEVLSTEKSIYLYDVKFESESLYDVLKSNWTIIKGATRMDSENEFLQLLSGTLEIIIFPMFEEYLNEKKTNKLSNLNPTIQTILINQPVVQKTIKDIYKEKMSPLRFEYSSDILNTNFKKEYKDSYKLSTGSNWRGCQKRLSIELPSIMQEGQLPIDYEASIFLRIDEDNPMIIRSLITGPHDTPYESGCFIFDLFPTHDYPKVFKNCWYMNTGNKRFNPNLYETGKVCLSILGTWGNGTKGDSENWNEKTSSLLQVLLSIQAQILISEPYFNEPGYESLGGTPAGIKASKEYNYNIRYYTMCYAIRDFLKNPKLYPQFENVVLEHFRLKKQRILETCEAWCNDAVNPTKEKMIIVYDEIKELLKKY